MYKTSTFSLYTGQGHRMKVKVKVLGVFCVSVRLVLAWFAFD